MEIWETELINLIERYCKRHNAQMYVSVARLSQLKDANGEQKITVVSRSKMQPELLPVVKTVIEKEIAVHEEENKKLKVLH